MRLSLFLFLCLIVSSHLAAKPATSLEALSAVNEIRASVDLPLYSHSDALRRSAKDHARYLALNATRDPKNVNNLDLHKQRAGNKGFSGVTATDRSAKTSYPSRDVKENISIGNEALSKSLTGLMSAIYHRFTFLDYLSDSLGYGTDASKDAKYNLHNHVFNMGREDMESACRLQPEAALPIEPVDCLGTTVRPEYINNVCADLPDEALYAEPFTSRCPNGRLLNAEYMKFVCDEPPSDILFSGSGSYYSMCKPKIKVDANWFDNVCSNANHPALHSGDNRFYKMCESNTRVNVSWFKNFCDSATPLDTVNDASYYQELCQTSNGASDFNVSSEFRNNLDDVLHRKGPEFIVWPPLNADEVSPVFYDEMPDPLPDVDVSGYPLSLQFNPALFTSVDVSDFKLEVLGDNNKWSAVKAVRELNHQNDPHDSFAELEFAWFPLKRLDWDTSYRASVVVRSNGAKANNVTKTISWAFKTKSIDTPLLVVNDKHDVVNVPAGEWFTLYHVPSKKVSRPMQAISAKWNKPARVVSEIVDLNTVRMKFENIRCDSVVLSMKQRGDLTLKTCRG